MARRVGSSWSVVEECVRIKNFNDCYKRNVSRYTVDGTLQHMELRHSRPIRIPMTTHLPFKMSKTLDSLSRWMPQ